MDGTTINNEEKNFKLVKNAKIYSIMVTSKEL